MAKKKTKTERKPRTSRYTWCEDEIVELIVQPKIVRTIQEHEISSKAHLLECFRERYHPGCSPELMNEWLARLGITFRRSVVVEGLPPQGHPGPGAHLPKMLDLPNEAEMPGEVAEVASAVPEPPSRPRGLPNPNAGGIIP